MSLENIINSLDHDLSCGKKIDDFTSTEIKLVQDVISQLDTGKIRIAEKNQDSQWKTNEWIKKAILIFFRLQKMSLLHAGDFTFWDKIPVKKWTGTEGVRVVPPAFVRKGAYVEPGVILLPSFINIGAYVGSGTLVDTWVTVGSCAQIGKNVHLSGGVGIGGVLEPVQAKPVIIEDNTFIGSRCVVVEGVHIEQGAVLGAGVILTSSTKIIDVTGNSPVEYKSLVPKNCVVIPGSQNKKFPAGEYAVPCALIIGKRKESTDMKTSLTQALRDFQVPV